VEELVEILMGPLGESTEHHPWHRAERGEIGVDDLQDRVAPYADARGVELHGDEIAFLFEIDFGINQPVVDRLGTLRAEGYRTALVTNSFQYFRATLEGVVDMTLFDVVVDSSEVGYRKPEPAIYDLTSARLGVEPSRIIFLDDFGPNVTGARAAGWTAIHVTDAVTALNELDAALTS
jgi:epoxide hydrolase-like predicted phosphatase